MAGEVVYRRAGEAVEVLREGDADAQYVCRPLYRVSRRDEPAQAFEDAGWGGFRSFEAAVEECLVDAARVAAETGADAYDGGLSFSESSRTEGEWTAHEWDTLGCDWRITLVCYGVADEANGGDEAFVADEGELRAYIADEIAKGWF